MIIRKGWTGGARGISLMMAMSSRLSLIIRHYYWRGRWRFGDGGFGGGGGFMEMVDWWRWWIGRVGGVCGLVELVEMVIGGGDGCGG